jgi:hypothetical protein
LTIVRQGASLRPDGLAGNDHGAAKRHPVIHCSSERDDDIIALAAAIIAESMTHLPGDWRASFGEHPSTTC